MKRELIYMFIFFLLILSVVKAHSTLLQPESIVDPSLNVGKEFILNVKISDVKDLYSFQFELSYDPRIINAKNVKVSFLNKPLKVIKSDIDNKAGTVQIVATSLAPAEPKSGSGSLAIITFRVMDKGKSSLELKDVSLMNYELKEIRPEVRSGTFDNSSSWQTLSFQITNFLTKIFETLFGWLR